MIQVKRFVQDGCRLGYIDENDIYHEIFDSRNCQTEAVYAASDEELCGIAESVSEHITSLNDSDISVFQSQLDTNSFVGAVIGEILSIFGSIPGAAVNIANETYQYLENARISDLSNLNTSVKEQAICDLFEMLKRNRRFSYDVLTSWYGYQVAKRSTDVALIHWASRVEVYTDDALRWTKRAQVGALNPSSNCDLLCASTQLPPACELIPENSSSSITPVAGFSSRYRLSVQTPPQGFEYIASNRTPNKSSDGKG